MKIANQYQVIEKISETSNNIVYKVSDTRIDEILALKLLKSQEPGIVSQFKREYFILQTLEHPNIAKVYNFGKSKKERRESFYFTMEYVEGLPFNLYFRMNNYSRFLPLFLETLNILNFIHKKGYLHCDLKPNHILIDEEGKIKLVDFGFAQFQKAIIAKEIGGTLRYLSPEILRGEKPDTRTDIYSMGIIGYESLTQKEAFNERKTFQILESVLYKNLQPIKKKKNIPVFLNEVIMRMAAKQRLERFASFDNIIKLLQKEGKYKKEENIEKLLYSDFIGRKEYINYVYNLVNKPSEKEGQFLLIEGISGTGKTRLLKEIEHRLFLDDKDVQYTRLTEETKFNFNWLIALLEMKGADLSNLRTELEKGKITLSEKGRFSFFDTIAEELIKISQNKIQVFLLDDVDFSDTSMINFIQYFSNVLEKAPFLFIATTEGIPGNLNKIIENRIYKNVNKLNLSGFNKDENLLFVKNMLGVVENVERFSDLLFENTNGNPYFTEELLREIVNKGLLKREGDNLIYNLLKVKKIPVPDSVGLFIEERIKTIPSEEKEIFELISVLGDSIPFSWLVNLSPFNESKTTRISEGSYLKQFLSISEKNSLDFTHKIVRNIVYDNLKEKEKRNYHKKILKFLETLKETSYILHLKAHHSFISKDLKADSYLLRLLKKSIKSLDVESAIDSFEKIKKLHKEDILFRTDKQIFLKIGNLYYHAGKFDKAISLYYDLLQKLKKKSEKAKVLHYLAMTKVVAKQYKEAEKIFEELLKARLLLDQRFEVLSDLGWFYYTRKKNTEAEEIYKKAFALSKKLKKKDLIGRLYYNYSLLKLQTNELEKAAFYGNKLIRIAKKYEKKFLLMQGLSILSLLEQIKRRYNKAITYYKKLLRLLGKTKDLPRKLHSLSNLARLLFSAGKIEESKKTYFDAISEAKKLGNFYEIALLYNLYGRTLFKNAEWKSAIEFLEKSNKIAGTINNPIIQLNNLLEISSIYAFQGKKNELEKVMEKALSLKVHIKSERELLPIELMKGIQEYSRSNFENTLLYLNKIEDTIGKYNFPEYQIPALIFKSLCLFKLSKKENALKIVRKAEEIMDNSNMFLFKEEVEFTELLILTKDLANSKIKNKFNRLLNKTREHQRFLYARVLSTLSDTYYYEFLKKKRGKSLSESIALLRKARRIFTGINAKTLILEVNAKLLQSFEKLSGSETLILKEKECFDIIALFADLIKNLENPENLKAKFITFAKTITGAERGLFITIDHDADKLIVTGKGIDDATIYDAKEFSKTVIKKVTRTKKPLIAYDAINEEHFKNFESVKINKIRSILCIPIVSQDKVFGTVYLDSRAIPRLFSKNVQNFMSSLSILIADSLTKVLDYKRRKTETLLLRKTLRIRFGPENLIGRSTNMQEAFNKIEKFAACNVPVLIIGETGTGKELAALSIHLMSERKDNNYLVVDCSTVSPSLIESELFGYKKGAFTGAVKDTIGHFEAADKGTIFIDEIANAPYTLQARFLRFLDTQEVKKIGAVKFTKVDTRIIVASNQDLYQLVKKGKFKQDLFHRLSKFVIHFLPLRERKEDLKPLIDYYIEFYNKKYNKTILGFEKEALKFIYYYEWPGNVRELKYEIDRCVFYCNKRLISKDYISPDIYEQRSFLTLKEIKKKTIEEHLLKVLSYTKGNISLAARILKTSEKTIYRNMKEEIKR